MTAQPGPGGQGRPLLLLLLYALLGGASFSIAKFAVGHGVPASGYAFWQCAGSGAVMLAVCLLWRRRFWTGRQALVFYTVTGLICLALPNIVMFVVLRHIPAGIMAMVVAMMPLLTYGLALVARSERANARRLAGLVCGLAGVLLILLPRTGLPDPAMTPWVALAIATPALYSLGNIFVSRCRPAEVDVLGLTFGMLATAALGLLLFTLATDSFYVPRLPLGAIELAIAGQVFVSGLGYILFFEIIRLAGPVFFSQIGYLVTISGMSFGMLFHDETYSIWVWGAVLVIFAGLALVSPRRQRPGVAEPLGVEREAPSPQAD